MLGRADKSKQTTSEFLAWAYSNQNLLVSIVSRDGFSKACKSALDKITTDLFLKVDKTFDPTCSSDSYFDDETVPAKINAWVESADMASVYQYHKETVTTTMVVVSNIVDCQLFLGLVSGAITMSVGKEGHIGFWKKLPSWILRWYCIGMMRKHGYSSRADRIEIAGSNVVDLTTGDLALILQRNVPRVKLHSLEKNGGYREVQAKYVSLTWARGGASQSFRSSFDHLHF